MLKKLVVLVLAMTCFVSLTVSSFANTEDSMEVTEDEIVKNGTLVSSEVIDDGEGRFLKQIYEFEEIKKSRNDKNENTRTVLCKLTPVVSDSNSRILSLDTSNSAGLRLTIQWVSSNYATDWFENEDMVPGYRLTRVSISRTNPGSDLISLQELRAFNIYSRLQSEVGIKYYDMTGSSTSLVTKQVGFSSYIPDALDARVGAELNYIWNGRSLMLDVFWLDN